MPRIELRKVIRARREIWRTGEGSRHLREAVGSRVGQKKKLIEKVVGKRLDGTPEEHAYQEGKRERSTHQLQQWTQLRGNWKRVSRTVKDSHQRIETWKTEIYDSLPELSNQEPQIKTPQSPYERKTRRVRQERISPTWATN